MAKRTRKAATVDPTLTPGGLRDLEAAQALIAARGDEAILSTREAAAVLGRTPSTLADWRRKGRGPRYMKPSAHYRYGDLRAWLNENTVGTTDQPLGDCRKVGAR